MSGCSAAEKYDLLQKIGITHVLTVMPFTTALFKDKGIKYLIISDVKDSDEQNMLQHFPQTNAFIKQALAENETNKVLVHCAAGVSRSGTCCCAYMI